MTTPASDTSKRLSTGTAALGFEAVRTKFDAFLLSDAAYSAQLCIYWRGEPVVDLSGGADLAPDSITGVFSASKGVSGIVVALLVDRGLLDLEQTVAHYWPEFAANGKDRILVRELLSHQAGLPGVDGGFTLEEVLDSRLAAEKLAAARPLWRPGSTFGYHGLTLGFLLEELVRRVAGETLQQFYEREIRAPRAIDFYLGLPRSEEPRYREMLPMAFTPQQAAERDTRKSSPDSLGALMNNDLPGRRSILGEPLFPNVLEARQAGSAAIGGVGSGRGLAQAYAALSGPDPVVSAETIATMSQQQVWGLDRSLNAQMCFGIVFMKPQPRMDFGSYRAFGHDGAGGAIGFADPLYDLAFGYVPLPMQYPGGCDPKAIELSHLARACIRRLS